MSPDVSAILNQLLFQQICVKHKSENLLVFTSNIEFLEADHNYSKVYCISIYSRDNELIEEGDAVADHSSLTWKYIVVKRNTDMSGTRIVAKAFDRPGNEGVMEVTM